MRSKALAEAALVRSDLPYTSLRLPSIYGARDTVVTPAIVPAILEGGVPRVSSTDRLYSPLYVGNLADAVARCLEVGPLDGCFNLTDGDLSWTGFVEEYARCLGAELRWVNRSPLSLVTHLDDEGYLFLMANSLMGAQFPSDAIRRRLDWEPPHRWQDGVREAVDWFVEHRREAA